MKQDEQTTGPSSANRRFMPLAMLGIGIVALPYFAGKVGNGSLALSAAVTSTKPGIEQRSKTFIRLRTSLPSRQARIPQRSSSRK